MFRKQALILAAVFGLAAAAKTPTNAPKPPREPKPPKQPKQPKAPHAGGMTYNELKKIPNYQLCTTPYNQYVAPYASQGAFTVPVSGGTCDFMAAAQGGYVPTPTDPVGVLSGVCGMNPYGGRQFTYFRQSTGGANAFDVVGGGGDCTTSGGCDFDATGYPQFEASYDMPTIAQSDTEVNVQNRANNFCEAYFSPIVEDQTSTCYGTLAIRGMAHAKNKYPGSELDLAWETTTAYRFVGATYTVDTQYGLGGSEYQSDVLYYAYLNGYSVFDTITCNYIPVDITHTRATVMGGSGKYEKSTTGLVGSVDLTTAILDAPVGVSNPYNFYQNGAVAYETNVKVNYIKKGGYLHYSLL